MERNIKVITEQKLETYSKSVAHRTVEDMLYCFVI